MSKLNILGSLVCFLSASYGALAFVVRPSSIISYRNILRFSKTTTNDINNSNNKKYLDLPWGDRQKFALIDNINKYTVDIPQIKAENGSTTYVMWRAMMKDTIELAGYDPQFLQQMCQDLLESTEEGDLNFDRVPGVLPLLDQFEFAKNGGVSGKIQGLRGIADGTTVQTSPLAHVQLTVPRGYVLTEDGSAAYELGSPQSDKFYSLDFAKMRFDEDTVTNVLSNGAKETGRVVSEVATSPETTNMLVNVGASTVTLLGGATLVNMISHHMTVNVFWV